MNYIIFQRYQQMKYHDPVRTGLVALGRERASLSKIGSSWLDFECCDHILHHPPPNTWPWLTTVVRMTVGVSHHMMGSLHTPVISHAMIKDRWEAQGITDSWRKGRKGGSRGGEKKRNHPALACQLLFVILSSLQCQEANNAIPIFVD